MEASKANSLVHATARGKGLEVHRPAATTLVGPLDAIGLLKSLRRRWMPAAALGLVLAAVVGSAAWYFLPKAKYTASATLRVSLQPKRIIFEPRDGTSDPNTFQRTLVALIKDRYILGHALSKPEVAGLPTLTRLVTDGVDAEEYLQKTVTASFREGSEVLEISMGGDRPEDLAAIVNAVIDSYLTLIVDEERKERLVRLEKLEGLWNRYQSDLKLKRKSLEELVASVGSHDELALVMASQSKTSQLSMAESEMMKARSELLKIRAELSAPDAAEPPPARPEPAPQELASDIEALAEQDPAVADAQAGVAAAIARYKQLTQKIRNRSDPSAMHLARQIEVAKGSLEAARQAARTALAARARPPETAPAEAPVGAPSRRVKLVAQAQVLEGYQEALKGHISQLAVGDQGTRQGRGGPGGGAGRDHDLVGLRQEGRCRGRGGQGRTQRPRPDPRARPGEDPPAAGRVAEDQGRGTGGARLVRLHPLRRRLPRVPGTARGRGGRRDQFPRDQARRRTAGVAAPRGPGAGAANLPANRRWQSSLIESIDATRTLLLHASRVEAIRVVMITSAVKGEGKTSLSAHLATSMSRAGIRTLLIDGDLRRPALHRLFDALPAPGLCDLLRGEVHARDVVQPTPAGGLSLITAGRCDPMALQALAQGAMTGILDALREDYEFVIVDSAPILPVADSLLFGQGVDAVIFSVLRDVSRIPMVHTAHERLSVLGVRILGAVLSGVRSESYLTSDYYYATDTASR